MKFLFDAHLPRRLALRLRSEGYDIVHTLDLPLKNRPPDRAINEFSVREKCAVVTKDSDFVSPFMLSHQPYKLLLVSTGNIKNIELEELMVRNIEMIVDAFTQYDFIEIDRTQIIFHQ
jgi:predicted nuclease of predicted toxin-antitoxin system